jgi:hypothetical protein
MKERITGRIEGNDPHTGAERSRKVSFVVDAETPWVEIVDRAFEIVSRGNKIEWNDESLRSVDTLNREGA